MGVDNCVSHMSHEWKSYQRVTNESWGWVTNMSWIKSYGRRELCVIWMSHEWKSYERVTNESWGWVTNESYGRREEHGCCCCGCKHLCVTWISHEWKSYKWVTNESRMCHEWVISMTRGIVHTNESRMSHEWVTNESYAWREESFVWMRLPPERRVCLLQGGGDS